MDRQPHVENRKRRLFAGVAGGTLAVLAGGVVLIECADPGDGGAIAAGSPVAAAVARSALSDPAESCPMPTPVPPLTDPDSGITCHASVCTPQFCNRGDIAALNKPPTDPDRAAIDPLLQRLLTLDCSPHSIAPVQIFAEADPVNKRSLLFQYYLLDSTGF